MRAQGHAGALCRHERHRLRMVTRPRGLQGAQNRSDRIGTAHARACRSRRYGTRESDRALTLSGTILGRTGNVGGRTVTQDRQYVLNIDRPCPKCRAQPGQPCRRPNGDKWVTPYGAPKWHARRRSTS